MTQEEKAKAYDEAIERSKNYYSTTDSASDIKLIGLIFPELKEIGDIRKRIIDALHGDVLEMGEIKKAIAWLEKQGNLMEALQISNAEIGELIEKNYYLKEQLEKQSEHTNFLNKIQIGDKVTRNEDGVLVNLSQLKRVAKPTEEYNITGIGSKHATGKLAEKIKKLELLKQGEQKSTIEMITPEESLGIDSETYSKIVDECVYGEQKSIKEHNACEFCEDRYGCVNPCSMKLIEEEKPADLPKGEDYGIDGLYAAIDILQKTLGEVDGYQTNDGILMHKCAISAVKELSKQKPAWSEEDVAMLDSAIAFVEHSAFTTIGKGKGGVVAWLKCLKERYSWKPSEGQLECLGYAIEKAEKDWSPLTNNRIYLTLKALKEQLLELRGSKV